MQYLLQEHARKKELKETTSRKLKKVKADHKGIKKYIDLYEAEKK